jgi:Xaa-Pro aminopeptidase
MTQNYLANTELPLTEFTTRRERFFASMPENSIALFPAAIELTRSNDTEYPFCQNKNFYYLTGFPEPDAVLLLIKAEVNRVVLFSREKDAFKEVWQGRRIGQELAVSTYGLDECFTLDQQDLLIPDYMTDKTTLLYCMGENEPVSQTFETKVFDWLKAVKAKARLGKKAPTKLVDCSAIIHEMRLIKSEAELAVMRKVNQISGVAHQRAMQKSAVGKFEYQIEAEILHEFAINGAKAPAYTSIVAGGDNGNILHYTENSDCLKDNEMLLIDAGGELAGYAADITRTFPINGVFTAEQKAIYQLVLDSQAIAIKDIKPQNTLAHLNKLTCDFLTEGLYNLGMLKGDLNTLIEQKACKKYFIHGLGHWLGLDVHDVGDYQSNQKREQLRAFEAGMVMTIEPGLYIPLDDLSVEEKWRGIAVRIEDNILVTATGYENLTVNAPKEVAEIETLMAKSLT